MPDPAPNSVFSPHDHDDCLEGVLAQAVDIAKRRGVRLTPVRRRALEILLQEHRALGAYEVLDRLAESGFGRQPPVAYRALDFLVSHGFAHRVRRLNAFAACMHPGRDHAPTFLICEGCDTVAESDAALVSDVLEKEAKRLGFEISRMSIEATGLCPQCRVDS